MTEFNSISIEVDARESDNLSLLESEVSRKWSWKKRGCCCLMTTPLLFVLAFFLAFIFIAYIPIENPLPVPDWAGGDHTVDELMVEVGGFYKENGDQRAWAFFPSDGVEGETFPLISFSHGDGGGGFLLHWAFNGILRAVAAHGFVVMAHRSCFWPWDCTSEGESWMAGRGGGEQWRDQVRVLEWGSGEVGEKELSTEGSHVYNLIDREKPMGVFGQSTGGRTSIQVAAAVSEGERGNYWNLVKNVCIGGSVALHPDPCVGEVDGWLHGDCDRAEAITGTFPYAVFTSSGDTTEPEGSSLKNYEEATTVNKAFASIIGIEHIKGTGPIWGVYTAAYFHVFLNGIERDDYYYDLIYGEGSRSLCGVNKDEEFMLDDHPICSVLDFNRTMSVDNNNGTVTRPIWCSGGSN